MSLFLLLELLSKGKKKDKPERISKFILVFINLILAINKKLNLVLFDLSLNLV